jgi:ribosome-associated toxin RatA of RatAB toxin-antitoxin module
MRSLTLSIPALLFSLLSFADAASPQDIIRLETVEGSRIKRGIVQGAVEATAEEVWQVITDYEHYTEFMPRTEKAEVRKRELNRVTYFSYLGMPWPIEDVAYVCDADLAPDHLGVEFRMAPGSGKGVKRFTGSWKLEPMVGKTMVTYTLFFEPERGYAPWLFDLGTKHSLAKVIQAVRKRIAARKSP